MLILRRKSALARLEETYEKFKVAKEDKKPWTTTRNGRTINHKGRTCAEERKRLSDEISHLKSLIARTF